MNTVQIKTGGMHCPSCSMLIELNVGDLPGVADVKADRGTNMTTVQFDPAKVSEVEIADEIRKAGYTAEVLA